jgi:shikimate dehydrogenase
MSAQKTIRQLGLIGFPLGHSFSKKYFTEKFEQLGLAGDYRYDLFPLEKVADLPKLLLENPNLIGLNVTIPHKTAVIPFLDDLDETAKAVGAVNTIRIGDGRLTGFNTDVIGFENSLDAWFLNEKLAASEAVVGVLANNFQAPNCLILGNGGASKAVEFVFKKKNWPFKIAARRLPCDFYYEDLNAENLPKFDLIIQTTPLGTFPNVENCPPIPFDILSKKQWLFDLIYNPIETLFLRSGKSRGCATQNGLDMLHRQAEAAWEIFSK